MNSIRKHPRLRLWSSRVSSLLLLVQRSPIIQLILPEAKILGGSAIADTATIAITTVVGLGAYDSVSGATSVVQVSPLANSAIVPAAIGSTLSFVYKNSNSDTPGTYQLASGTLPAGVTKSSTIGSGRTQVISGVPTATGAFPITLTAWEFSNNTGRSTSGSFTIYVMGFSTQPAATTSINSGSTATLTCAVTGAAAGATLAYQWYQGASGTTTTAVGTNSSSFTTPPLAVATNYWVKVSSTLSTSTVSVNSNTATVNVTGTVPAAVGSQPASTTVNYGGTATLSITSTGSAPLTYQWYQGMSGDTSIPISNSNSLSFTTPALIANTSYWVKVSNSVNPTGAISNTATVTVRNPFDSWMFVSGSGVPSNQNGPWDIPLGDGFPNILKYAFNLNPNIPDIRKLTVGAGNTAGLPGTALVSGKLRIEFIRRKGSPGITYTPQFGSNPSAWANATILNAPTSIDSTWERVVVDDPAPTGGRRFGRVTVTQVP